MPKKLPEPRRSWSPWSGTVHKSPDGSWLEPECEGRRRAYVRVPYGANDTDYRLRVVTCDGVPDTYFSIPANVRICKKRVRGYVTSDDNGYVFRPFRQ